MFRARAALGRQPPPCALNQNPPHGLRRRAEEVRTILELPLSVITGKTKPRLMHERSRLQRVTGRFRHHFARRELAQLLIDERQQFFRRAWVALFYPLQNDGDVAHAERISKVSDRTTLVQTTRFMWEKLNTVKG